MLSKGDIKTIQGMFDCQNERLEARFEALEKKIEDVELRAEKGRTLIFEELTRRMEELEERVCKRMDIRFDRLEEDMNQRFSFVHKRIDTLEHR
jgi:hypothetical protein